MADALGGIRLLAVQCDVSTWTVRAWIAGMRVPSPRSQRRLNAIAEDLGIRAPYSQWETGPRRRDEDPEFEQVVHRLRLQLTARERRFGFAHVALNARVCVVAEMRPGLFAVKVAAHDGSEEYALCDERLRPLYRPASSMQELRRRFPADER